MVLAPPALTAPLAELTHCAASHHHAMVAAAWLEGTGTLLYVIFALALVRLAGPGPAWPGGSPPWAAAAVLAVSLVYDLLLIAIAQAAGLGDRQTATARVTYGLFAAAEHVFLPAPPLLLPLGPILPRTPVPPRPFALHAVILGVAGQILGLAGLFTVTVSNNGPVGAVC